MSMALRMATFNPEDFDNTPRQQSTLVVAEFGLPDS
jgi:hypothetical protein